MEIIKVENLSKVYKTSIKQPGLMGYMKHLVKPRYKEFTAVNNISFKVQEGELIGYIGENGARKIYYD